MSDAQALLAYHADIKFGASHELTRRDGDER